MSINIIKRQKCIVCEGKLKKIKTIKNFPIYMSSVEKKKYYFSDMRWGCCMVCGCVQLKVLIEPTQLYAVPHNASSGKTWQQHNLEFSKVINKYNFEHIVDIGGANLKIANILCKNEKLKKYDIIDYLSNQYEVNKMDNKITMFIGSAENIKLQQKVDCIIMSHTIEHLYDPVKFLKSTYSFLRDNGKFIISIPNIKNQLLDGFLNALNFEHTFYIDDYYINKIFEFAGFKLKETYEFSKYNSFYVFEKTDLVKEKNNLNFLTDSINAFNFFLKKLKTDVEYLNLKTKNNKFYIFGAHIFSQYLINFGLNVDGVINIIDNDINKTNKCLYGTNLIVKLPDIIAADKNPIVIVRAAQFQQDIEQQLYQINKNVKIL